jgi:hypothetical protein
LNPEDEFLSKLKIEVGKQVPAMFRGMAINMPKQNKEVIINWLKEQSI